MKPGRNRNAPCPCGSGKKYKRCCMDKASQQQASIIDEIEQTLAISPAMSIDEINFAAQRKIDEMNNRANQDFCGLSSTQISNWMYAPFSDLALVTINTPDDLSSSPVMRYLELILEEAMQQGGSFKATAKGNLPTILARQASALLPEFALSEFATHISINEFAGANEEKFNALHYTRILAELAGIIYRKSGRYHVKKTAQKQYQTQGLKAFYLPMLEASVAKYNWSYLDAFEDVDLRTFWVFMLWRLQSHGSIDQLAEEVCVAFPALLYQLPDADDYFDSAQQQLSVILESRFIDRFLQFWGFVTVSPRRIFVKERAPRKVKIQPLLTQTFEFSV